MSLLKRLFAGTVAANHAGPALTLALLIAAIGFSIYALYGYRHSRLRAEAAERGIQNFHGDEGNMG